MVGPLIVVTAVLAATTPIKFFVGQRHDRHRVSEGPADRLFTEIGPGHAAACHFPGSADR
jgi:hypothetical protein